MLQREHIIAAVWLCKGTGASLCSFFSRASSVLSFSARCADEYILLGEEGKGRSAALGSEALGPGIYFSLMSWEISTCLFWKWSAISVNSIKVHIFVHELHRIALSNLPPLPIRLCLLAWRWWLEAAVKIVGRSSVLLLLWNRVTLTELQVWMWKKSDFLKNVIIFLCYMIAVYLGENWGFYENINAWFHAIADGKCVCYCRSKASGAICETMSFSSIMNPFSVGWHFFGPFLSFLRWWSKPKRRLRTNIC